MTPRSAYGFRALELLVGERPLITRKPNRTAGILATLRDFGLLPGVIRKQIIQYVLRRSRFASSHSVERYHIVMVTGCCGMESVRCIEALAEQLVQGASRSIAAILRC